jgi:hypothetical protein
LEVDPNLHTPSFNGPGIPPGRWHVALVMFYAHSDIRNQWNLPEGHPSWPLWFHWEHTSGKQDIITFNGEHLAFNEWGWDTPVPSFVPAQYRLKADGSTKTQGELYEERGWCPHGRIPVQGVRRPNIWGLVAPGPVVVVENPPVPQ